MRWFVPVFVLLVAAPALAQDADVHWSRQFPPPARGAPMTAATGMASAAGKPSVRRVRWHDGKLWMAGAWETGLDPHDISQRKPNTYWHLWSWSPEAGYEVHAWYRGAEGGDGPDGKLLDFLWLPDGRLVVAGSFTRLGNQGGNRYHDVNAVAVYDPKEETANRWKPLGSFQYNGTVSEGGSVYCLAYDPQGNDLYIGGTFGGIPILAPRSPFIHKYDLDTDGFVPMRPGVGGQKPAIYKIDVDTSTTPSTIYVGGKFHYTGGDGHTPLVGSSGSRWSTGFARYQEGKGWTTYPAQETALVEKHRDDGVLQRAADFMHFDAVRVLDFLRDGEDIWIVGAFSEAKDSGETIRGIAKWDAAQEMWIDPTGKGGVGREIWNVAKADNGKLYFAGAFGGRRGVNEFYDGFKNGDTAHMAMSYDPATDTWEQLGSGLSSEVMPECRLAVDGNDVWFVGDFKSIGPEHFGPKADPAFASQYVARWNETIDFVANPPPVATEPAAEAPAASPPRRERPQATGNEHWSRQFPKPPRAKGRESQMSAATGMDDGKGAPSVRALVEHEGTLYFGGQWPADMNCRWFVWSYHPEQGWKRLAWDERGKAVGVNSIVSGLAVRDGKLYAWGAIKDFNGIGVCDLASGEWSRLEGTFDGKAVHGNAGDLRGAGAVVNDVAWDERTGDMYLAGTSGLSNPEYEFPKDVSGVSRIDEDGNYHPMGHAFKAEDPNKPELGIYTIVLDPTKDPVDVYVGGTFGFYGKTPTHHSRMCFNVAKWNHEEADWRPIGKGITLGMSPLVEEYYPDGLPGLPHRPNGYQGFLKNTFPCVRDLVLDAQGNLWAGGVLAILDASLPVKDRKETFGIAKYDKSQDRWVCPTTVGGVSRDVFEMTFLDDTRLLLSGGFVYDEQWNLLNNVAVLDTSSGELRPLGGGLMREGLDQTVSANVVHAVAGDDVWFAGEFDHAGVNANSRVEGPVQSWYVARWNATRNFDPNRGLEVTPPQPVTVPQGRGSVSVKVPLSAKLTDGEGTINWYERRSNGEFAKKGSGETFEANARVKPGESAVVFYVAVTRPDGTEGGKLPVTVPLAPE